jgi:protein-disulfide isomerase
MKNGRQVGVRGTPTVFVNGKILKKRNLNGFIQRIETELRKKK